MGTTRTLTPWRSFISSFTSFIRGWSERSSITSASFVSRTLLISGYLFRSMARPFISGLSWEAIMYPMSFTLSMSMMEDLSALVISATLFTMVSRISFVFRVAERDRVISSVMARFLLSSSSSRNIFLALSWERSLAVSSISSMGLATKSSAPRLRALATVLLSSFEDMAIIGTPFSSSMLLRILTTSRPSRVGITRSRSMASGRTLLTDFIASSPLLVCHTL